jgi:hypothetical protein
VFDEDRFWVVDVDYAKATPDRHQHPDHRHQRRPRRSHLDVLPTMWFRNTWGWGRGHPVPEMRVDSGALLATHWRSGTYHLDPGRCPTGRAHLPVLCNNETNEELLFNAENITAYPKDGIDRHVRSARPASTRRTAGPRAPGGTG